MKKIISGKLYDTDTAKLLGSDSYRGSVTDFSYWNESLYLKRTGEYFLHGEGGPMSRYARSIDQNSWSGGERIIPLSPAKAREWAEEHLSTDEYEEAFGLPDEDAEGVQLSLVVPAQLNARLRAEAAEKGVSLTAHIVSLLER